MKSLTLNSDQRLQLESLLGAQRGNAKDMYLVGQLIGVIRLDEAEKKQAGYRTLERQGQEFMVWDRAAGVKIEPKTIELEDEQARRLSAAIEGWNNFSPVDQEWLGPIVIALADNLRANG